MIGTVDVPVAEVLDEFVDDKAARANARLISAAPDLLEAAKAVIKATHDGGYDAALKNLRAAIRKAGGKVR
jgi:hypothetical protein